MTMPLDPPGRSMRGFHALYRANYGLVWHALHRFGVGAESRDDATQEVFLIAYRRRDERVGASVQAWLYGIARRVASNHRRSLRRRTEREQSMATIAGDACPAREVLHAFDRCLETLPRADRELFVLSELEGLTGPELARSCGANVNTIYWRLRKLREAMRAQGVSLDDVRRARPTATSRGWVLLLEAARSPAVLAASWAATAFGAAVVSAALSIAVAVVGEQISARLHAPGSSRPVAPAAIARVDPPPESPAIAPAQGFVDDGTSAGAAEPPPAAASVRGGSAPGAAPVLARTGSREPGLPASEASGAAAQPAGFAAPGPNAGDDLAAQNELLARATAALRRGASARALELLESHFARFPDSTLADLRAAVRIDCLCALGEVAQARREAAAFSRRHPGSPVIQRIARACREEPQTPRTVDTRGI